MDWLDFINFVLPVDLKVNENETVVNSVPKFFKQLDDVLKSTSERAIANYLMWRVVYTTSKTLTTELRDQRLEISGYFKFISSNGKVFL